MRVYAFLFAVLATMPWDSSAVNPVDPIDLRKLARKSAFKLFAPTQSRLFGGTSQSSRAPCNSWVYLPAGQTVDFVTPHYIFKYHKWSHCNWVFVGVGEVSHINIQCEVFDLRQDSPDTSCRSYFDDVLKLFDQFGPQPQRYCAQNGPQNYNSASSWVYAVFRPSLFSLDRDYSGFSCNATAMPLTTTMPTTTTTTTTMAPTTTTTTMAPTTTTTTTMAPTTTTTMAPTTTTTTTPMPTTTTTTTPMPTTTTTTTPMPTTTTTTTPMPTTTTTTTPMPTTTTTTTPMPTTTTTTTPMPTTTTTTTAPPTTTTTTTSTTTTTTTTREPCLCGRRGTAPKIVGGVDANLHEFPWQAALVEAIDHTSVVCGAVVISDIYVLLAAHCVNHPQAATAFEVAFGEHDSSRVDETTETIHKGIASVIVHPGYSPVTHENDIALIELDSPIDLYDTHAIKPICFPDPNNLYVGQNVTVAGWGLLTQVGPQATVLQKVDVVTMTNIACDAQYIGFSITDNMLCAAADGKDSCQGDSGGALISQDEDHYDIIGVVSFGILCASPDYPGVYTRITEYINWIRNYTDSANTCIP